MNQLKEIQKELCLKSLTKIANALYLMLSIVFEMQDKEMSSRVIYLMQDLSDLTKLVETKYLVE